MWETLLLVTMLQSVDVGPAEFSCSFPAEATGEEVINLTLSDRPSLKDQPGLFRVELLMDGGKKLLATAQPIDDTDERDALVLARTAASAVLSVGFRDDGAAALWLDAEGMEPMRTRIGTCQGFEGPLKRWLGS